MATRDEHLRGYPMLPAWDRNHADPNWSAERYHGMRMHPGGRQAAYGYHRLTHQIDLLGYGGFQGLYDEGTGRFGPAGAFHHPALEARDPRARKRLVDGGGEPGGVEDGGVRGDNRYLRQYNAASPALENGGAAERGFGHAPAGGRDGELAAREGAERPTDERGYAGYNRGGFAPGQPMDPRK